MRIYITMKCDAKGCEEIVLAFHPNKWTDYAVYHWAGKMFCEKHAKEEIKKK